MKLVTKYGYKFVIEMFWQIAYEGRRTINLTKIFKDTKHNMFCQVKTKLYTWGFCHREGRLNSNKKIASLAKYIIETMSIKDQSSCIVCYKFKDSGEVGESGKALEHDLYGYVMLFNNTICPNDGEYVSEFSVIKNLIFQQVKRYDIDTLYLPSEVAGKFFSVFEVLAMVVNDEQLLLHIMDNLSQQQKYSLNEFIEEKFGTNSTYLRLVKEGVVNNKIELMRKLMREPQFIQKVSDSAKSELPNNVANIVILGATSKQTFWQKSQLKLRFDKCLIKSISSKTNKKYQVIIFAILFLLMIYFSYDIFEYITISLAQNDKKVQRVNNTIMSNVSKDRALAPSALIKVCLQGNDRFFRYLGSWQLTSLGCDANSMTLSFTSSVDTTRLDFANLIGESTNLVLNGRIGTYTKNYVIKDVVSTVNSKNNASSINSTALYHQQLLDYLSQAAKNYKFRFTVDSKNTGNTNIKFTLISQLSPIFLLNHGVLNNTKLNNISMKLDRESWFYTWTLKGELN